jgi:hypothetical protein
VNLASVMDELGTALETIPNLRVFPHWPDRINPPVGLVGWPDPLTYDSTMARGSDQVTLPITVLVGKVDSRSARDRVAAYADGSGTSSVKAAIDGFESTAYDSARVTRCQFNTIPVSGVEYLAATFFVDLIGTGA